MRAVVSGATSGLGGALAAGLAASGVEVAGFGSRDQPHPYDQVDIADPSDVTAWAVHVATGREPIGVVVANAAVALPTKPATEITAEQFRHVLEVNVIGVLTLFNAFVPYVAPDCVFIAMSSQWGLRPPRAGQLAYCASKFAVEGLVAAWRQEIGNRQKAYALDPGAGIDTPMTKVMTPPGVLTDPPAPLADWAARASRFVLALRNQPQGSVHVRLPEG